MKLSSDELVRLSQMFAFVGNSFLKPMSQTARSGLDEAFWDSLPSFGNDGAASALDVLAAWASGIDADRSDEAAQGLSVEYARLFIGPPEPLVAPWETFYAEKGVDTGFGEATFAMRGRLRRLGLSVCNENNQYDDHVGIELLYVSECLRRAAQGADEAFEEAAVFSRDVALPWISVFGEKLDEANATYYAMLARLACALLGVASASQPSEAGMAVAAV